MLRSQIVIRDIHRLHHTMTVMVEIKQIEQFARQYARLTNLFATYLHDVPTDWVRTATLWADQHQDHSFYWWISQRLAVASSTADETILAGAFLFHANDQTWGIHT